MTDAAPPPMPPAQNLALLKAVTAGLGLLLVGGVALLCVLLVTRGGGSASDEPTVFALAPGERLVAASAAGEGLLLTIETRGEAGAETGGGHRLVTLRPDGSVAGIVVVTDVPSAP